MLSWKVSKMAVFRDDHHHPAAACAYLLLRWRGASLKPQAIPARTSYFFSCESSAGPRHFQMRTCRYGLSFALSAEDVICLNSTKVRRCHVKQSPLQRDRPRVSAKLSGCGLRDVVLERLLDQKIGTWQCRAV
jgi:hypothetical protein